MTAAACLAAMLATGTGPSEASAASASAPSPAVAVVGQCPTAEAVSVKLKAVLGAAPDHPAGAVPRVVDRGDRFEVTVLGQTRQYLDGGRDCEERARVAAVSIALTLNPPTFLAPPRPLAPAQPVPAVEPRLPQAPPVQRRRSSLALALRLDAGNAGDSLVLAPGAEVRGALRRGWLGVAVSAGVLAPEVSRVGAVPVREQRFPLGLTAAASRPLSAALDGAVSLGLALVPFTLQGQGLATSEPATRVDVGTHLGLEVALRRPSGGLAPFVDVHAEVFPRAYVVNVGPLGDLGTTAHLWIGMAAGVALESNR